MTGRPELAALPPQTSLFGPGVGLDSLAGTLLLRRVRARFGVDVAAEDLNLDALATLGTLTAFIEERAAPVRPGDDAAAQGTAGRAASADGGAAPADGAGGAW